MASLIKYVKIIEEVCNFYFYEDNYYALTSSGTSINIIRSINLQPKIYNPEHYFTYLFVEAKEGFFLFRQPIIELKPGEWYLEKELVPNSPYNFFYNFLEAYRKGEIEL